MLEIRSMYILILLWNHKSLDDLILFWDYNHHFIIEYATAKPQNTTYAGSFSLLERERKQMSITIDFQVFCRRLTRPLACNAL